MYKKQELNQCLSTSPKKEYHIHGKTINWSSLEVECFWKKELMSSMKEFEPNFIVDDRNRKTLAALYDYVWKKSDILDPSKGLLLWGPIGTGKSTLLKGLQRYYAKINRYCYGCNKSELGFKLTSAVEISLLYTKSGMDGISKLIDRENMGNLAIDEIGKEPQDSKHFGTSINVIQTLLQLRYEVRQEYVTHGTTNLDPNTDFIDVYDSYIADRAKEMFNIIHIKGESRRKQ